jgi:hypothetical protein
MKISKLIGLAASGLIFVLVATGCATASKINWDARVGSYTYDQAVLDFGPPMKFATLTDGTKVAEWQTQRGYATVDYLPHHVHHHRYCFTTCYTPVVSRRPDVFLRLTFDPAGRLSAWKKALQ